MAVTAEDMYKEVQSNIDIEDYTDVYDQDVLNAIRSGMFNLLSQGVPVPNSKEEAWYHMYVATLSYEVSLQMFMDSDVDTMITRIHRNVVSMRNLVGV